MAWTKERRQEYQRDWMKRWREEHPEKHRALKRLNYERHKEHVLERNARSRSRHGEKWNRTAVKKRLADSETKIGRKKPAFCEVCHQRAAKHLDHNHKTEKVRGWLCSNCNQAIGLLHEDAAILKALISYLEREGAV